MAKPKPKPRLPPIKVKRSGGITAWHASPHLFDAFDSSRIGTGEGAQAYGHGLYFAGRRPTSEWYYNKFADQHPYYGRPEDELRIGEGGTVAQRRSFADDLTGADEMALDIIESVAEGSAKHQDPVRLKQDAIDELATRRGISDDDRKSVHASLIKLLAQGAQWPPRDAHLYKVNIDADPESFLDWNRVASVQSPQVKQALSDLGWFSKGQLHRVLHPQAPEWYARTGNWLYHNLLEKADRRLSGAIPPRSIEDADRLAKELVATELVASGVPGIRYLDGMSRSGRNPGRPSGARTPPGQNYVMFPGTEDLIRIVRRYGFIPPAVYMAMQGDNNQASASEPQDKGMIPVEGKPGTFAFPDDIDAEDARPAEDLRFQRATPVPYPTRDEAFQMYRSGLLHSAQEDGMAMARASAAYEQQYDSVVGQRTKELVAQGVDPVNAELRATKEFELGRPTIRKAGGGAMSPNEFLANFVVQQAGQFGVPEDQISGAVDMARQYVTSGGYGSELDKEAHQALLGILEANAPQGFESDRSGIGQEELDRLRQKYGDNANFMYPDWQRTNFDALRQYELLSHGTDLFEPGHASNEVLKVAGGVFNPEGPFGGSFTKGYTPDTPEGDALYWYKLSRNTGSQEPGYHSYRDPDTNDARFWKHSTTTLSGLLSGGLSGADTSRRYGRAAAYTMPLGQNPTVPAWQRQLLTDVRTNTNRDVPVIPTNKTPQQMSRAHALVEAYDQSARDWLPTAYRRTFRQHPTQFQSMLYGLIHDSTDPATAVDAAVSVAGGGALGAYRNVAKNAGKGVARSIAKGATTGVAGAVPRHLAEEASYGAGQSALLSPLSALVTPDTDNPLAQREDGSFAQPTDRDFDAVTGINIGDWRAVLGNAASQYYGKKK